jgi:hypothetical protein
MISVDLFRESSRGADAGAARDEVSDGGSHHLGRECSKSFLRREVFRLRVVGRYCLPVWCNLGHLSSNARRRLRHAESEELAIEIKLCRDRLTARTKVIIFYL